MFENRNRLFWVGLAFLAVLPGVISAVYIGPYQVDDAYITYRYVTNYTQDFGLVFNQSGLDVEGFSSPAWLFFLIILKSIFNLPPPIASPLLGVLALIGLGCIGFFATIRAGGGSVGGAVCVAMGLTLLPVNAYYAITGLEQVLFGVACLSVTLFFFSEKSGIAKLVVSALAVWIRPEAPWLVVSGIMQSFSCGFAGWRDRFRSKSIQIFAAIGFGLFSLVLIRLAFFHEIFPATYYAKNPQLSAGIEYLFQALSTPWVVAVIGLGFLGGLLGNTFHRSVLLAAVAWLIPPVIEGGDHMANFRFFSPALTLFVVAAGGIAIKRRELAYVGLLGFLLVFVPQIIKSAELSDFTMVTVRAEDRLRINWLNQSNAKSVALMDIGQVGFFTSLNIFDFAGLTDIRLAKSKGGKHKKTDLDYFFTVSPDVVFIRSDELPTNSEIVSLRTGFFEANLFGSPRFHKEYQLEFVVSPGYLRNPLASVLVYTNRTAKITSRYALPNFKFYDGLPLILFPEPESRRLLKFYSDDTIRR